MLQIGQRLRTLRVFQTAKAVFLPRIAQTLGIHLPRQPFMPIEAQRHVEGKPRLQPKMHQAVDWMQKIKVVVQTFAGGELQTQFPAGGVPAQKIGQARLRARPQTDQTFADAVACRHFARDFILPCAVAAQKSNRPPGRFGQYLTLPPHPARSTPW